MKPENSVRAAKIINKTNELWQTIDRLTGANITIRIFDHYGVTIDEEYLNEYQSESTDVELEPYRKFVKELIECYENEIEELKLALETL